MLIRLLVKEEAGVQVLMTDLAKSFITPLTLATLSKKPILVDFYNPENGDWNSHVDLGTWADAYLIAPATANTIAKMAHGIADNLLLTTYLSARCPVFVAPAMDLDMFVHPATRENLDILQKRGNLIIEPATGELASGLEGKGRMEEPEKILQALQDYFGSAGAEKKKSLSKLKGKTVLITAGPTFEDLDPVRFIGNHSTGKMGYALAAEFRSAGAKVILVSGPTSMKPPEGIRELVAVRTADQMYSEVKSRISGCDIAVFAAAVADYKPSSPAGQKIKSTESHLNIQLEKTVDIAFELGKTKKQSQIFVGFALETEKEIEHALGKLLRKNLDFIVLNSLRDEGAGFGHDTNKIRIIDRDNKIYNFGLKMKTEVAHDILETISKKID